MFHPALASATRRSRPGSTTQKKWDQRPKKRRPGRGARRSELRGTAARSRGLTAGPLTAGPRPAPGTRGRSSRGGTGPEPRPPRAGTSLLGRVPPPSGQAEIFSEPRGSLSVSPPTQSLSLGLRSRVGPVLPRAPPADSSCHEPFLDPSQVFPPINLLHLQSHFAVCFTKAQRRNGLPSVKS